MLGWKKPKVESVAKFQELMEAVKNASAVAESRAIQTILAVDP